MKQKEILLLGGGGHCRSVIDVIESDKKYYISGIIDLKKNEIQFINPIKEDQYFNLALKKGLNEKSVIYIWGKKSFPLIEKFADKYNLKLYLLLHLYLYLS